MAVPFSFEGFLSFGNQKFQITATASEIFEDTLNDTLADDTIAEDDTLNDPVDGNDTLGDTVSGDDTLNDPIDGGDDTLNDTLSGGGNADNIGTNFGFVDYSSPSIFSNFLKSARNFRGMTDNNVVTFDPRKNTFDDPAIQDDSILDSDGYPTFIPSNSSTVKFQTSFTVPAALAGDYIFEYDGEGSFAFSRGITSQGKQAQAEFIKIDNSEQTSWLEITAINPQNYPRNFRIRSIDDSHPQVFNQVFLDSCTNYNGSRTMDIQRTNRAGAGKVKPSDRVLPSNFTYFTRGVAWEDLIELGNVTRKPLWVCVPHAADVDYMTEMATAFRDSLDPNVPLYVEYSNECWNSAKKPQFNFVQNSSSDPDKRQPEKIL